MKKIYLNKEKKKTFPARRQGLPRKYAAGLTNCHISDRKEYSPVIRCALLPQLANARVEAPKNTTAGQRGTLGELALLCWESSALTTPIHGHLYVVMYRNI